MYKPWLNYMYVHILSVIKITNFIIKIAALACSPFIAYPSISMQVIIFALIPCKSMYYFYEGMLCCIRLYINHIFMQCMSVTYWEPNHRQLRYHDKIWLYLAFNIRAYCHCMALYFLISSRQVLHKLRAHHSIQYIRIIIEVLLLTTSTQCVVL